MKRFVSFVLCLIFAGSCLGIVANGKSTQEDFQPVLRFVASSDTHLKDEDDTNAERVQSMMEYAYSVARKDASHPTVDALIIAGDTTHDGTESEFQKLQAVLQQSLKDETELLAVAAKNHDGYHMSRTKERETISAITGKDADFHVTLAGYHFIGLSVSGKFPTHYDKGQLAWLREQLDAATKEDPNRPVFVIHHEHVKNTVYGSSSFERWGVPYFNEILEQYPQAVDFSGHSHYPLNHPNSVWQGAFTAIGTGAIKSTDYTVEDMRDIAHSPDNAKCSTFWIVEVDKDHSLHLQGIDLLAGKVLCEYFLNNPADPQNRSFTPENKAAVSKAPIFKPDAALQVSANKGACTVSAPLAASGDGFAVVLYRAYASDAAGKTVAETWTQPQYFIADGSDTVDLTLKGLSKGTYTISVVAETAYGVQSKALTAQVNIDSPGAFAAFWSRIGLWIAHAAEVAVNAVF